MPDDDDRSRADEPTARERAQRRDRPLVQRAIVSDALMDPEERERIGFDPSPDAPIPVVVELNLRHPTGWPARPSSSSTTTGPPCPAPPSPTGWPTPTSAASSPRP